MNLINIAVGVAVFIAIWVICVVVIEGGSRRKAKAEQTRRNVEAKWRERADPVHHTPVTRRRKPEPEEDLQSNLLNPLNPLSPVNPISPLNPLNQVWQPEPTRESHRNDCQSSYQDSSSSSSSYSSDSCSSSSSSD
jgi:hypothetical protein